LIKPSFGLSKMIELLPNYGAYLAMGILSLVFIAGHRIRNPHLYFYVFVGVIGFAAAVFTQIPLQTHLAEKVFMPKVNSGGSRLLWAVLPSLPAGIIQELLKFGIILAIRKYAKTEGVSLLIFGAAAGVGFGIAESAYVVSQLPAAPVWSITLIERGFFILFHATTGVLLGALILKESYRSKFFLLSIVVLANSFLRYLPVFAQNDSADMKLLYLILPLIPILLLAYSVFLLKSLQAVHRR
jgi:hypothetical protein